MIYHSSSSILECGKSLKNVELIIAGNKRKINKYRKLWSNEGPGALEETMYWIFTVLYCCLLLPTISKE